MVIQENIRLAPYTTFGIGGAARWFVEATSEDEIAQAAAWTAERGVAMFVLGGGSNLLISDGGFDGLVLHVGLRNTACGIDGAAAIYRVAAGEDWDGFVERAVRDGCAGVECLAGIPGTVGGTPVQNVGAYGQEVASAIERVRAFDLKQHAFVELSAAECGFAYRRSRFNWTDRGRFIVTRVDYRLTPGGATSLRYADLQKAFADGVQPTLTDVTAVVRRVRQSKGMLMVEGVPDCRSAGSFFKNPVVPEEHYRAIAAGHGGSVPHYPAGEGRVKLAAAWLIEQAGFPRGMRQGEAAISSRHTLALINAGHATAAEILALARTIAAGVELHFHVRLEREPVFLMDPVGQLQAEFTDTGILH